MSNCVRLLREVEKKEVPFKGRLSGVTVLRHGRKIRVENESENDIRVGRSRRPVKPNHHAIVESGVSIELPDGVSVIARL